MAKTSRRKFLAQTTAVVLASSFGSRAWAEASSSPIGLELYTVGEPLAKDPAGTLHKIAALGYQEVEVSGFANLTPAALRKLIDDAGLKCPAAHLQFGFKETAKVLEEAKALRVPYAASSILLPASGAPPSTAGGFGEIMAKLNSLTADDFKRIAERANRIGEEAKKAGVQFAYHNHTHEFRDLGGGETGYAILLAETDPVVVQFEADCGWMVTAGADPIQYFQRHPNRYRVIHVKDFPAGTKVTTTMGGAGAPHPTELGRGHIDYKPILAAAKRAGVEHFFVEQDPPMTGMTPLEAAEIDYAYMKLIND
ncbi:sugar phosphate isomerase/epimerase family protein [Edaphobacter albus]|uniref:sugar phosphate isomerase/epimerase family protein n=1 Tax=Edaphobacter sp. 4G125 TaxID=2763071 RepID=UPI001646575C|nr:sugar phosphate isomerase/epimerase [Edaphobacter sp. 4G125]QNI36944.1 sugar phosphate isomerase/epimerase [Edaphobacter sp. 4G125]